MPSSHPSSVFPFSSCPQSLPASGSFPMSQLFAWSGQSIGASASAPVLPMNIQLFYMLSRFVIAFPPRSKCLLISWLQLPSTMIFGVRENKVCHCFHFLPIYLPWSDRTRLEKEMATQSSILAWRIPWTEKSGGLQSIGSQRDRHDWATKHACLMGSDDTILVFFSIYLVQIHDIIWVFGWKIS